MALALAMLASARIRVARGCVVSATKLQGGALQNGGARSPIAVGDLVRITGGPKEGVTGLVLERHGTFGRGKNAIPVWLIRSPDVPRRAMREDRLEVVS